MQQSFHELKSSSTSDNDCGKTATIVLRVATKITWGVSRGNLTQSGVTRKHHESERNCLMKQGLIAKSDTSKYQKDKSAVSRASRSRESVARIIRKGLFLVAVTDVSTK